MIRSNGKIIWLASYPKSGNTWMRILLANYLSDKNEPVLINDLFNAPIASDRQLFDANSGISSSELTQNEIELYKPIIYNHISEQSTEPVYFKVHDAYQILDNGKELFPANASNKILYIVRNPFDVTVSFSEHLHISIDKTINVINNEEFTFCEKKTRLNPQLYQKLSSWSSHYKSWTKQDKIPCYVIKYEDLITDTYSYFSKIIDFFGIELSIKQVKKAVKFSNFAVLKEQEKKFGFKEKNPKHGLFFRTGKKGGFKSVLSQKQISKIYNSNIDVIHELGYNSLI